MSQKQETGAIAKALYSLTAKICELGKIGEQGRIDNFLSKIDRKLSKEISELEHNKKAVSLEYRHKIASIQEEIEDAENRVEEVTLNVNLDRLNSNSSINDYIEEYMSNVADAEEALENLKEKLTKAKDKQKEKTDAIDEEITSRKATLARLGKR